MFRTSAAAAAALGLFVLSAPASAEDPCCAVNGVTHVMGQTTKVPVSVAFIGTQGYAAWMANNSLYVGKYDPVAGVTQQKSFSIGGSDGISIAAHKNALYVAWDFGQAGYMTVAQVKLVNGNPDSVVGRTQVPTYFTNHVAPQLIDGPDALYITWADGDHAVPAMGRVATDGIAMAKK